MDVGISIHALREEGDLGIHPNVITNWLFLSTPSARRATQLNTGKRAAIPISIHALREEGDPSTLAAAQCEEISIHALREEGDLSSKALG